VPPRIQQYEEGTTEETRKVNLDSIEEHHMAALMRHTRHEQHLRRYHDRNVRERSFNVGDLVLRRIQDTKGNAQALRSSGRSLHRDGIHQSVDLPPLVGRLAGHSQRVEHRAFTSLLCLEDLYQNKSYVLYSLVILIQ
jgi:hypothetical protein